MADEGIISNFRFGNRLILGQIFVFEETRRLKLWYFVAKRVVFEISQILISVLLDVIVLVPFRLGSIYISLQFRQSDFRLADTRLRSAFIWIILAGALLIKGIDWYRVFFVLEFMSTQVLC